MKKTISMLLVLAMVLSLAACGSKETTVETEAPAEVTEVEETAEEVVEEVAETTGADDWHIGIVTGSVSQGEDDRRGAEAFQAKYGADKVFLAIYPDNFTEEQETTIQTIVNLSDDPQMKAIIVQQAVNGTTEAFRQIKEKRPDILCIAGTAHEETPVIAKIADITVGSDFVARGHLIVKTAHDLGCDTFCHVSFARHLASDGTQRRLAIFKATCEELGMTFAMENAPDPITEVGVSGAQAYILEQVPTWIEKYGPNTCFFCTNDAHTEPLVKKLLELGCGYMVEADLPSPLMGYPGALGVDLTEQAGDFPAMVGKVEEAIVEKGGAGRFGTWMYSLGYTLSAGLAEHAKNCIEGTSVVDDMDDLAKALHEYTPTADWAGSNYVDATTGVKYGNAFLIYMDTYIMGDPGFFVEVTKEEVPEKYFYMK